MATIATLGARALRRLGVAVVAASDRPSVTATSTVAEIGTDALRRLGVVASDETPAATDQALAEAKVYAIHEGLVRAGLVAWAASAIPRAVAEPYSLLVALHLATAFGKAGDPAQIDVIEARIKRVSLVTTAPALAEQAVYAVHVELEATGRARWSALDIPVFAEEPYVVLAAARLAFAFGVTFPPAYEMMARVDLARLTSLPSSGAPVVVEYH